MLNCSHCHVLYQLVSKNVESVKLKLLRTVRLPSVPNILLAFIPAEISPSTMNIMTAFAVRITPARRFDFTLTSTFQAGGLLSDVFVHLIPHSFMGGEEQHGVRFVMVEEKRNVLIG